MKTWIKLSRAAACAAALMLAAPVAGTAMAAAPVAAEMASEATETMSEAASAVEAAVAPEAEAAPTLSSHQAPLEINEAATAWIIVATALVLMMTLPGLALFYGGMVRKKNVIATVTQSVAVTCVVAVLWYVIGYSISFGVPTTDIFGIPAKTAHMFMGGFDVLMLKGVTTSTAYSAAPYLPEMLWIAYQMTFAIITPALITGAFAERIKLSGLILFMSLWTVFVYAPICHQVWGGGYMFDMGVLDFAGGAVVHVNSGVAGLVAALFLGRRKGYGTEEMPANNLVFVMIGASLLFVGWIGFNAGSAWVADGIASAALLNTMLAACASGLTWKLVEWTIRRKPSLLGILSGIVAGLVAITPAAGFVNPTGALIIGLAAGPFCYMFSVWIKKMLGYDDSLDAFGIHGAGGVLGAILTGLLADPAINALGEGANVITQLKGLGFTIAWSAIGTLIILIICKFTTGLRVSEADEEAGLDSSLHDEALHH
ncbi:ammonium transporter [Asticcacaulis sp. SL142]|uniref:ammonium transporter n=1 Tax=Asticcacaulis sp. SL142 TaxID=2995155 RepID=UPI00226CB516|nr:ammonium transporter [Asticcacaulis sp. SL142]WAC48733.1 ammonium transporter [Asticcacaulis sp. SL142]